jgi:hypothetical protein
MVKSFIQRNLPEMSCSKWEGKSLSSIGLEKVGGVLIEIGNLVR